jgi:hypothetical protein
MDKKYFLLNPKPSGLAVRGTTLHIRSMERIKSVEKIRTSGRVSACEKFRQNFLPDEKKRKIEEKGKDLSPIHTKTQVTPGHVSSQKTIGKVILAETLETDLGKTLIRKVQQINTSNNGKTRSSTALKEKFINKSPLKLRPQIFSPLLARIKFRPTPESLLTVLQKMNGISLEGSDDSPFKYFLGNGNNPNVVKRLLEKRPRWRRVFSASSANFCWTAVKKTSILDALPVFEGCEAEALYKTSDYPHIIPNELCFSVTPNVSINISRVKLYNKLPGNFELTCKKNLMINMTNYYKGQNIDPFSKIPLSFHLTVDSNSSFFKSFQEIFEHCREKQGKIWIVKPGEFTNRGNGIKIFDSVENIQRYTESHLDNSRSFIIQKYLERPFLFKSRKFDIRCYALFTSFNGNLQVFYFREGYLRTSGEEFVLDDIQNRFIHLTNDAIQKNGEKYGKYEKGNKLSYLEFQEYLNIEAPGKSFFCSVLPKIKSLVKDSVFACFSKLNPTKKLHCFEVIGYDFMVDDLFNVWLIEANTNPCLELSSPYLEYLIPKMLDQALALSLDQLFPSEAVQVTDFELIFNEVSLNILKKPFK